MLSILLTFTSNIKHLKIVEAPPCVNPYRKHKNDTFEHSEVSISDDMKAKFEENELARLAKNPIKYKNAEILSKTAVEPKDRAFNLMWIFDEKLDADKLSKNFLQCKKNVEMI